jgi:hypothetical protein
MIQLKVKSCKVSMIGHLQSHSSNSHPELKYFHICKTSNVYDSVSLLYMPAMLLCCTNGDAKTHV